MLCKLTKSSVALVWGEPRYEEMFGVVCDHIFWVWWPISENEHAFLREDPEEYGGIECVEKKFADGGVASQGVTGPCLPFFSFFDNAVESRGYSIRGMNAFKSARFGYGGRG